MRSKRGLSTIGIIGIVVLAFLGSVVLAALLAPPPSMPTTTLSPVSVQTPTPTLQSVEPSPQPTATSTPSVSQGGVSPSSPSPSIITPSTPSRFGNVTVHFINVGQGDSIFIDTNERDVLIDGGIRSAGATVVSHLRRLGVTRIDIVVGTHPDEDHIGGLITVLSVMNVSNVLDSGDKRDTRTYRDYIALAKQRPITTAERGQSIRLDAMTVMTILAPRQPLEFKEANENSVVIRMTVNNVSFLFTGDAGVKAEDSILNAGLNVDSDILKIGHHGSRTSTSSEFLSVVNPEVAVISMGTGNRYGHPHTETLNKLAARNTAVYRTDLDGTVTVTTNGVGYTVKAEKQRTPTSTVTVTPASIQEMNWISTVSPTPIPTLPQSMEIGVNIVNPVAVDGGDEEIELYNSNFIFLDR